MADRAVFVGAQIGCSRLARDYSPGYAEVCNCMIHLNFEIMLSRYESGERDFQNVVMDWADGFECNLRGIDLRGSTFIKAYMPYCNLSQANLQQVTLRDGNLGDAKLFSADLTKAVLAGTNLSRADLRYARLPGANLQNVDLTGADLTGADLTGADLTGAILSRANLTRTQLQQACLKGANLFRASGGSWKSAICDRTTILPDGHYY